MKIYTVVLGLVSCLVVIGPLSSDERPNPEILFSTFPVSVSQEFKPVYMGVKENITPISHMWEIALGTSYHPVPVWQHCLEHNCKIKYDGGGRVVDFLATANLLKKEVKRTVVIDGPCISACTGLVELIKDQVCITPNSSFWYHTTNYEEILDYYPQWTLDWVDAHGGFPNYYLGEFTKMDYQSAKEHWRQCSLADMSMVDPSYIGVQ